MFKSQSESRKLLWVIGGALVAVLVWLQMRGTIQISEVIPITANFGIHLYGLIIVSAVGVCAWLGSALYKKLEHAKSLDVVNLLLWLLVPGIIGARAYHVITEFQLYQVNPINALAVWNGGLNIIGGLIGGGIGLWLFSKHYKISFESLIRVIIVVVPLGQTIGRLGNLINQEVYGLPTNLPWAIYIKPENRLAGYREFDYFHPLFLYESIFSLLLFWFLYRKFKQGETGARLVMFYLAGYGIIRYLLDFIRLGGVSGVAGLSYTQWLILGLFVVAFVFGVCYQVWYKHKHGKWYTKHNYKTQ